jgi:hypothetical protein
MVLLAMAGDHGLQILDYCWRPSEVQEPDCERRVRALVSLRTVIKHGGVKLLGYMMGADAAGHIKRQCGIAREKVEKIEAQVFARIYLSIQQALWAWTAYVLPQVMWAQAVGPRVGVSDALKLEILQERALKAILGNSIGSGARINSDLLLAVFRLSRLADRRLLDRACYHYHSVRARSRPWRGKLWADFEALALEDSDLAVAFRQTSPTAAILDAVATVDLLAKNDELSRMEGEDRWSGSSEEDEVEDQSSTSQEEGEEESESGSDESGQSFEKNAGVGVGFTDDDPLGRRWRAKRLGVEAKRLRTERLLSVDSAALFNAFCPSERWLKALAGSCRADEAGLSVLAMLVGAFWPCSQVRCSGRPRRCACGYVGPSQDLRLHFIFGNAGDGVLCTVAVPERAEYVLRITDRFENEGCGNLIGVNDPPSIGKLARWLGGGDRRLPRPQGARGWTSARFYRDVWRIWASGACSGSPGCDGRGGHGRSAGFYVSRWRRWRCLRGGF